MAKRKKTATRTRAVVVRSAAPKAIVVRTSAPVARRGGGRVRRAGRSLYAGASARKMKIGVGVASAVYGYAKTKYASQLASVPYVSQLGRELTWGVALTLLAKPKPGGALDHLTTALVAIGGHNLGVATASNAAVQGDDISGGFNDD